MQSINMQQPHKSNLIDSNSTGAANTKFPPYKKSSVKINGQISETPIVPAKPARTAITTKNAAPKHENGQLNRSGGAPTETDEIEFLLEEIKDLEVPACRTDSEQDFEIAGSRVDLDLSLQLDSPIDTSWYYSSIQHFYSDWICCSCCWFLRALCSIILRLN